MKNALRLLPLLIAAALATTACKKDDAAAPAAGTTADAPAAAASVAIPPVPAATDVEGWKAYLTANVKKHMDRRYRRPYMYFIPAAGDDEAQRQYDAQLESVQNAVGRGIQAGSMLAFGGPDPGRTAQVIVDSFALAGPKSLKGVRVVYIGTADQRDRAAAAVAPSEAEFIYEEMANLPPAGMDAPASAPGQATPLDQPASMPGQAPTTDPTAVDPNAPTTGTPPAGTTPEGGAPATDPAAPTDASTEQPPETGTEEPNGG